MKKRAVIIDLDGTLCNADHRRHHVENQPKNWKAFYDGMCNDEPHEWCKTLYDGLKDTLEILFVTGRPANYEEMTRAWLHRHGFEGKLFMRPEGDFRADWVVKTEIYMDRIAVNFDIVFCVDDRKQVVDAWRKLGLTCLQCAEGNF